MGRWNDHFLRGGEQRDMAGGFQLANFYAQNVNLLLRKLDEITLCPGNGANSRQT
ncbi:hypothetical protein [Methyloglobulus sp.]|uniref:hypothetical protein n=1 Tax=Methyloglobulus sp. TaxID=2518622 RepID=UPI003988D400